MEEKRVEFTMLSAFQKSYIDEFSQASETTKSSLTLAGTGPNGSIHVPVLHALGDRLASLASIDVISASSFSLFIYLAAQRGELNTENYLQYEHYVRKAHALPVYHKLKHLCTGLRRGEGLYSNSLIAEALSYLIGPKMIHEPLSSIPLSVNFYAYCMNEKKIILFNKESYPQLKLIDLAAICISIPVIHGAFHYQDNRFVDPIYSPAFSSLRRDLFKQSHNNLYVNHVKTKKSGSIWFFNPDPRRFPNASLWLDFALFYMGITNRKILKTHRKVVLSGALNGSSL